MCCLEQSQMIGTGTNVLCSMLSRSLEQEAGHNRNNLTNIVSTKLPISIGKRLSLDKHPIFLIWIIGENVKKNHGWYHLVLHSFQPITKSIGDVVFIISVKTLHF